MLATLLEMENPDDLRRALMSSRLWRVSIVPDRMEFRKTPGHGYCGFIAMDRIINGLDRTISPCSADGIDSFLKIIETLSTNSTEPLRHNWQNLIHRHRSPKECLAMTAALIKKNRTNWMAVQELPEEQWLNSGVLNDTSRLWNYSRWSITPVLSETHLTMIESIYSTNAQASAIEWEQILDSKMLCHEVNHFYTRQGALIDDFRTAMERCIQEFIDLIFPNWQRRQTDSLNDQGTSAPPNTTTQRSQN